MANSSSVGKSPLSTTVAVIITAIIVGSVVGGATSYFFASRTDSTLQQVRSDLRSVADAIAIPIDNPDAMKKLMEERKVIEAARQEGRLLFYSVANTPTNDAMRAGFERKYPFITVEVVAGATLPIANRFIDESAKGKSADVVYF